MNNKNFHIIRITFGCLLFILMSNCAISQRSLQKEKYKSGHNVTKPNIIFFLVDDLGWSVLGYEGSSFYETPNIDKFASEGVSFTNAYAASHV